MKKIYISGPITGLPYGRVTARFEEAAAYLKTEGFMPLFPTILPEGLKYEEYMQIDFAMIDICDAVYMLLDWQESPGAVREREYAKAKCKEIKYEEEM